VSERSISYRDAGVDLDAAGRHTAAIASLIAGGQTGFAAAHPLPAGMREPMLVTCTDGVGTKLLLARELGRIEGLGQDLVAMCVNDMACTGAQPTAAQAPAARPPRCPASTPPARSKWPGA